VRSSLLGKPEAYRGRVSDTDGFVEAMLRSPLGVALLAVLEAGPDRHGGWARSASASTAATVATAVEAIGSMSFGDLLDAAVYTGVLESGPWIDGAPLNVASGYRDAAARAPLAQAIHDRFGGALHAPMDPAVQQWWADDQLCREPVTPLFGDFDHVYGAGQFTVAGLWTVTDPPPEIHDPLVSAWEYEVGPVSRWWLRPSPSARVFEVHRPEDWVQLVTEHPREGGPHPEWELPGINQDRTYLSQLLAMPGQRGTRTSIRHHLVPDWRSVAKRYDGVRLSWAGFITAEGCITDLSGGDVAMLRYWFSERTLWLADVFGEPQPAPPPARGEWGDEGQRSHSPRNLEPLVPPDQALLAMLAR
jgi:hypothetical protein